MKTEIETPSGAQDLWIFAYGSLMWDPRFRVAEDRAALLRGYRRTLCILSIRNRGTPETPGLVVGLDRGGSCRGRALRVEAAEVSATWTYLQQRELATNAYLAKSVPVILDDGRLISAVTFVACPGHAQYRGCLTLPEQAALIVQGKGPYGTSLDYLRNVIRHLDDFGILDTPLHEVLALAEDLVSRPERSAV